MKERHVTLLVLALLFVAVALSAADNATIMPSDDEDIGYGSVPCPQLWYKRGSLSSPYIVGKGNQFDHRYRLAVRLPLDTLLAYGKVEQATFRFKVQMYPGDRESRSYLLEILNEDIMKLKANDLSSPDVLPLARLELGRADVGKTIKVDVTEAVQHALDEVWSSLVIRFRPIPEDEPNDDSGASGLAVELSSLRLTSR